MRISREKIEHCAVEAGRRTIHFGEAAGRRIRRFSRRTWIIIVIVAVVVAGGLYWLLKPAPPQPKIAFGSAMKFGASPGLFQKPRPDMVQPRLPPITYQPLKKF